MLVLDENEDEKGDEDEPLVRRSQSLQMAERIMNALCLRSF